MDCNDITNDSGIPTTLLRDLLVSAAHRAMADHRGIAVRVVEVDGFHWRGLFYPEEGVSISPWCKSMPPPAPSILIEHGTAKSGVHPKGAVITLYFIMLHEWAHVTQWKHHEGFEFDQPWEERLHEIAADKCANSAIECLTDWERHLLTTCALYFWHDYYPTHDLLIGRPEPTQFVQDDARLCVLGRRTGTRGTGHDPMKPMLGADGLPE